MARRKPPDDDDRIPVSRDKIVVPFKRVLPKKTPPPAKKTPAKKTARRRPNFGDAMDFDAAIDGMGPGEPEMEGLPQTSRRSRELEAQMRARLFGEPVFPYPPELPEELKPYWTELVNSFPKNHFQISDTTLMKMYCQCAYDIERQSILIADEGEVVMGGRGQAIVNPRCKVRESNRSTLLALATKFRNQPASRVNTENFKTRSRKAAEAGAGASAVADDEDGLLASGEDDDLPHTRH